MALISALERRSGSHPSNPDRWFIRHIGAPESKAGVAVDEDSALSATAVWAGVRMISETLAMLPCKLKERIDHRTNRDARTMGLYSLLHDAPNTEQTSFEFREMQQGFMLLWGNCYAQLVHDGRGEVSEIWPLVPWRVTPERSKGGALTYRVQLPDNGGYTVLPADDVLHIRGFSSNGLLGDNIVERFRDSIGLSLAAEEFGGRFFGNGLAAGGVLEHPGKLGVAGRKNVRESFNDEHTGVSRSHRLMILEEGMKWHQTTVDPEKAQALETRKFQVTEVARILNLPPHLLKDLERATFTNIEHQGQEFVTYSMQPWLTRWEQRLNRSLLLPSQRSRYFTQFEVKGLLRGDSAARSAFYTAMFNMGAYSPNDILENEDEEPVEGGDQRFVQLNLAPLDKIAEMVSAQMKAKEAPPPKEPDDVPPKKLPPDDMPEPRSIHADPYTALEPVVRAEVGRIVKRRIDRVKGEVRKGPQKFRVWADNFFEKEAALVAESLYPAIRSLSVLSGRDLDADALATRDADRALAEIRKALLVPDDLDARIDALMSQWESERTETLMREIMDRPDVQRAA